MSILNLWMESQSSTSSQKIYGVVIGIVTNNQDPENLGRVKVKFPWLSNQDESNWARIATPMGGKERGIYFLPEVEDEVLVIFEQGDLRFPYILGGLWNGKDTPPINNSDGKNNQRLIKSRSGHTICLNDEEGKETIEIIDKTGNNQIKIDTANNTITLKSDTITLESDKDIILRASKGKITLEAQSLEVKTSTDTKIEAGAGMDIKASGPMNLKGATINLN